MKILFCLSLVAIFPVWVGGQQLPYTGGNGSGSDAGLSAGTSCRSFYGGNADGATASLSAQTTCPPFYGGNADGAAVNHSVQTICPPFFGGPRDGHATDNTGCSVVLAIRQLDFYGQVHVLTNSLHWKTEEGYKVKTFEVEKSADGTFFNKMGSVEGSRNNNFNYLYIDDKPFSDISFYRLRIIEKDNQVSYSKIIFLKRSDNSFVKLYPNPFKGAATLYYYSAKARSANLILYQSDGKTVMYKPLHIVKGENRIALDIHQLAKGIYFLLLREDDHSYKLIVEKN